MCPQCGDAEVVREKKVGRLPLCAGCREVSRQRRLKAQRDRRAAGVDAHRDKLGQRYDDPKRKKPVELCEYCTLPFTPGRHRHQPPACPACWDHAKTAKAVRKNEAVKASYARDPQKTRLRRLETRLERIGLSLTWFVSNQVCGICGTTEPKGKGGWHIDHDHTCCSGEWWQSCGKCIRGMLCHHCNVGLGNFHDDARLLRRAIEWLGE